MSKHYDVLVIGPVSLDHNIDYLGNERKEVGGAVVASGPVEESVTTETITRAFGYPIGVERVGGRWNA